MKQTRLMKSLVIRHKLSRLKLEMGKKVASPFVKWEREVNWKLRQAELQEQRPVKPLTFLPMVLLAACTNTRRLLP